jgi:pimeloyl-ACP methyl ester carboxylesterase
MIKYADFRNIKVRYSVKGKGRVVVLLHGFLESLEVWDELAEKLSRSFRVIAMDLPGHGKTPHIGYIHTMEMMAQYVKSVLDSLQLRKYVVTGHSMGGYVALALGDLFPENISGLCLFHSSSMPDSEEKKQDRLRAIEAVKKDKVSFTNQLIDRLFAPENAGKLKSYVSRAKQIARNTSKQGIVNALAGMRERPSREKVIRGADYPVLFIIGKQDSVLPYESLMVQAKQCRHPHVLVLEHTGHMGFYEAPEETFKAIRTFARRCFTKKF